MFMHQDRSGPSPSSIRLNRHLHLTCCFHLLHSEIVKCFPFLHMEMKECGGPAVYISDTMCVYHTVDLPCGEINECRVYRLQLTHLGNDGEEDIINIVHVKIETNRQKQVFSFKTRICHMCLSVCFLFDGWIDG